MRLETERLIIAEFDLSMAESVHKNSLYEDNRRFVPDEGFEKEYEGVGKYQGQSREIAKYIFVM